MVLVGPDQACSPHPASLMRLHSARLPTVWRGSGKVWQEPVLCTLTRITSELPPNIHETARVNTQLIDFLQGKVVQGLERCSVEKNATGCPCRGPGFDSQHPQGSSQPSVAPVPGDLTWPSAGTGHACGV